MRFSRGIHPEMVRPPPVGRRPPDAAHAGGTVAARAWSTSIPATAAASDRSADAPRSDASSAWRSRHWRWTRDPDRAGVPGGARRQKVSGTVSAAEKVPDACLAVTVPPHRLDIQAGAADLIEELARIHGYDRMPATLLADPLPPQTGNSRISSARSASATGSWTCGLQEVITYSLTTPEREAPCGRPSAGYVTLVNPISTSASAHAARVLAGVLEVAAFNLRHTDDGQSLRGRQRLHAKGTKLARRATATGDRFTGKRTPPTWQRRHDPVGDVDFYRPQGRRSNRS